jgi:Co/Zn/Cd efflux system component
LLAITHSHQGHDVLIGYLVLIVAGLAEFTSFVRALWQIRQQCAKQQVGLLSYLRTSTDTTVKTALFEDSTAMIGLVLAAAGLGLRQLTGSEVWDGAASIAIGGLLVAVAIRLGLDSRELLIGRAAGPQEQQTIRAEIEQMPGIDGLLELLTMQIGPEHLIVAARVAFSDQIGADAVEDLSERIDRRLSERLSVTPHVFIDPTDITKGSRGPLLPEAGRAGPADRGDPKISAGMPHRREPGG